MSVQYSYNPNLKDEINIFGRKDLRGDLVEKKTYFKDTIGQSCHCTLELAHSIQVTTAYLHNSL